MSRKTLMKYAAADVELTRKFYERFPSVRGLHEAMARMFWEPTEGELVLAMRWNGEDEGEQLGRVVLAQPGPSILVEFVDFDNSRAYYATVELRPLDAVTALARLAK